MRAARGVLRRRGAALGALPRLATSDARVGVCAFSGVLTIDYHRLYTKNNISFSKNCASLNGNILTINNNDENIFNHSDFSNNITNFN